MVRIDCERLDDQYATVRPATLRKVRARPLAQSEQETPTKQKSSAPRREGLFRKIRGQGTAGRSHGAKSRLEMVIFDETWVAHPQLVGEE